MMKMIRPESTIPIVDIIEYDNPVDVTINSSDSLLGDAVPSIALVGTSYSEKTWNFPKMLAYYTKRDVLDVSLAGQQIWIPMQKYLSSTEFKEAPPRILVWEVPERYLLYPPGGYRVADTGWLNTLP
ncbi:hypothetical protein GCM10008939_22030 [Deinococcus aquiradiocola]|uniref:AlgX/AlgJ SGNH hydrolase-like domain-containing protein n=2 Tax=Deinococcus aquiradiocola TaxID=393059 RepID=A0A917UQK5_9DEIO|nr:hypothetical protein GCM10008939_22030 [Deinococcus aquiradiocola]